MESEKGALLTHPLVWPTNFDRIFVQTNLDQTVHDIALFQVIQIQELEQVEGQGMTFRFVRGHLIFCPVDQRIKDQLLGTNAQCWSTDKITIFAFIQIRSL